VVVVGVGVLGLFALLSSGLDSSARAVATTQATFLADATMNALRARSALAAQSNQWATFWSNFAGGSEQLTVPVPAAWQGFGSATELKIRADDGSNTNNTPANVRTLVFLSKPLRGTTLAKIPHGQLRYRLKVSAVADSGRELRRATLLVWPGAGPTDRMKNENAIVFYSEFANVGSL
jgi:hypothetical protein